MECDPARRRLVALDQLETGFWQCTVWCWILGIRFAEQPVQLKSLKESLDGGPKKLRRTPCLSIPGIPDVKMHISAIGEGDLVDIAVTDGRAIGFPR